jgi:hypothetical protein
MGRTVRIAFKGDRRHGNDRAAGELPLQIVILCLALCEADAPTIVVDHNADMISIVEGCGAPIERRVVESPFR